MLSIIEERNGTSTTAKLEGDLVAGNLDPITTRLKALIAEGVTDIRLDFTTVVAIDSAGVGFLAAVHNTIKKQNGTLLVKGLSREMYQFFVSLRLNAHFKIEAREEGD